MDFTSPWWNRPTPVDQEVSPHLFPSSTSPSVFLLRGYDAPAIILRTLLLRAGIEPNPGPDVKKPPKWPCPVCRKDASRASLQCSRCRNWVHFSPCSKLSSWDDFCRLTFLCQQCSPDLQQPSMIVKEHLTILQINVNGLRSKVSELTRLAKSKDVDVITLQETKLGTSTCPKILGFSSYSLSRPANIGGGIAIYIRDTIPHRLISFNRLDWLARLDSVWYTTRSDVFVGYCSF